jgi:hypothetical protein
MTPPDSSAVLVGIASYGVYAVFHGLPEDLNLSVDLGTGASLWGIFVLGLLGGLLTFGGAYTGACLSVDLTHV